MVFLRAELTERNDFARLLTLSWNLSELGDITGREDLLDDAIHRDMERLNIRGASVLFYDEASNVLSWLLSLSHSFVIVLTNLFRIKAVNPFCDPMGTLQQALPQIM